MDDTVREKLLKCFSFISKLKYLGSGRNRAVYLLPGGKYVIKIPINALGLADNDEEHCFRHMKDPWAKKERVFARCRLIPGTFLLVMEYVEDASYQEIRNKLGKVPEWVGCIDSGQVGFNRQGKLVAYDYGRH